jgi:hypothetical protein
MHIETHTRARTHACTLLHTHTHTRTHTHTERERERERKRERGSEEEIDYVVASGPMSAINMGPCGLQLLDECGPALATVRTQILADVAHVASTPMNRYDQQAMFHLGWALHDNNVYEGFHAFAVGEPELSEVACHSSRLVESRVFVFSLHRVLHWELE